MNCLEARNRFVSFWRKTLDGQRREQFVDHLRECTGCDHSFRVFALTAPVLYTESRELPDLATSARRWQRAAASRPAQGSKPTPLRFSLRPALAASLLIAAAGLAAYLAVHEPQTSLEETLSPPDAAVEMSSETEFASPS